MKGLILVILICSVLNVAWGYEKPYTVSVDFSNGAVVDAEVAVNKAEGLMFREGLGESQGMFFDFGQDGKYNFWMKNMKFPIDIIWINSDFQVVYLVEDAKPCVDECTLYTSEKPAQYVLEVPANFASKNGLKVGDTVGVSGL